MEAGRKAQHLERERVFRELFQPGPESRAVTQIYQELVDQSRRPGLYTAFAVPDTVIGRFDMIVLHAFLVFHRLKSEDQRAQAFCQRVFDHMFVDMDRSLREMGVGDLSVGKKVKSLARSFYGRVVAYDKALMQSDDDALCKALVRNIYPLSEPDATEIAGLAQYVRSQATALAGTPVDAILGGKLSFSPVRDEELSGRAADAAESVLAERDR